MSWSPDGNATGISRLRAPDHGEVIVLRLRVSENREGLSFVVPHTPEPSPEGKVAAAGRRMRCHRVESLAELGFAAVLCDV